MKKTLNFTLILLITTALACNTKITKDSAKIYYEKIKYINVTPSFLLISEQNHKTSVYVKEALLLESRTLKEEQLSELQERQENIIIELKKAIANITNLENLGDNTNLKQNTLDYLKGFLDFEENTFNRLIEILDEGIEDNEIDEIASMLSFVSDFETASIDYKDIEIDFLIEFDITNDEVGELNIKYGLEQ